MYAITFVALIWKNKIIKKMAILLMINHVKLVALSNDKKTLQLVCQSVIYNKSTFKLFVLWSINPCIRNKYPQ